MAFTLHAPAKINLYLKVLGRRRDGFHTILSLMQMVGLYDTLTFQEEGADIRLEVEHGTVPADRSNLILKAARMLQKEMRSTAEGCRGVRITLEKNIPVAAGLGGGSSDAAATLLGLNCHGSLHLSRRRLSELGGYVGSDVPFFFYGPAAWVSGRGERVSKIASPLRGFVVLVHSGEPVSTASVYHRIQEEIDLTKKNAAVSMGGKTKPSLKEILASPENDLEKVTLKAQPELKKVKCFLEELGGRGALMSGSGPTVFARFEKKDQADAAARSLREKGYNAVWVAKILERVPRGFGSISGSSFSDSI